jgi:16S rRNA (uracil1498-N3)-methyltransferase
VSFVRCENSERTELKTERLRRIALSAVKQSRKAWMPQINEMKDFSKVVSEIGEGDAVFICHCHEGKKEHLNALLQRNRELLKDNKEQSIYVFVGPEGDFSEKEVKEVMSRGAVAASLGESRLRTETAGLVAVHLMHLNYEKQA